MNNSLTSRSPPLLPLRSSGRLRFACLSACCAFAHVPPPSANKKHHPWVLEPCELSEDASNWGPCDFFRCTDVQVDDAAWNHHLEAADTTQGFDGTGESLFETASECGKSETNRTGFRAATRTYVWHSAAAGWDSACRVRFAPLSGSWCKLMIIIMLLIMLIIIVTVIVIIVMLWMTHAASARSPSKRVDGARGRRRRGAPVRSLICIYIYIYIYRERERDRERERERLAVLRHGAADAPSQVTYWPSWQKLHINLSLSLSLSLYMYIHYIYIYRERER